MHYLEVADMSVELLVSEISKIESPCDNCQDNEKCLDEKLACLCFYYFASHGKPTERKSVVLYRTQGRSSNGNFRANIFSDVPSKKIFYKTFRVLSDERKKSEESNMLWACNKSDDYNWIPKKMRLSPK